MLVGRDETVARLARALAAAAEGDGSAFALVGEPGVRKTALLDFAIGAAGEMQVAACLGVGWPATIGAPSPEPELRFGSSSR